MSKPVFDTPPEPQFSRKFGKIARQLRTERSLLLGDMAKALGMCPAQLSAYENGRVRVPLELVEKTVAYFNLEADEELQSALYDSAWAQHPPDLYENFLKNEPSINGYFPLDKNLEGRYSKHITKIGYEIFLAGMGQGRAVSIEEYKNIARKVSLGIETQLIHDREMTEAITERDYWEEKATELSGAISKLLEFEAGEHSNTNCPVQNAINEIEWRIKESQNLAHNGGDQ